MGRVVRSLGVVIGALVMVTLGPQGAWADEGAKQAAVVGGELSALAHQLSLRPETALDFTKVSGEYCFDVNLGGGGHMVHYATDPTKTQEAVIDFVNADPLIKAGINVTQLPRFPGRLGSMTAGQWYYLPAGEFEPHHGVKFPFPLLLKATSLK